MEALAQDLRAEICALLAQGPADLRGLDLVRADLSGLDLSGCDLRGQDLSQATLRGARLIKAQLQDAVFFEADLQEAELLGANLSGADLHQCSAARAGFGQANLREADLSGGDFSNASFSGADLEQATMSGAELKGARMVETRLAHADCSRVDFEGADLSRSEVRDARFREADMRRVRFTGVRGYEEADWILVDIRQADWRGAALMWRHILDENYLWEFKHRSDSHHATYMIWKLTSDCGRRPLLWGLWTAFIAVVFAGIYEGLAIDYGAHEAPLSSLYFSIVTLTTLGFGDVLPADGWAQAAVLAEVVLGYVMLGGLLSIFANKMARRA